MRTPSHNVSEVHHHGMLERTKRWSFLQPDTKEPKISTPNKATWKFTFPVRVVNLSDAFTIYTRTSVFPDLQIDWQSSISWYTPTNGDPKEIEKKTCGDKK